MASEPFVTCDIENRGDGSVLEIDTYDGEKHYTHTNWKDWTDFIIQRGALDQAYRRVYAHNGCGWDWLSWLEYYIRSGRTLSIRTIQSSSRLLALSFLHRGVRTYLLDSFCLVPVGLDVAGSKLIGERKLTINAPHGTENPHEWLYENDRESFTLYHRHDTEMLYRIIQRFGELCAKLGTDSLGVTLPSTAMKLYTKAYADTKLRIPTPDEDDFVRRSYFGGRVSVLRPGKHNPVYVYDVNSHYPAVMSTTSVPYESAPRWTTKLDLDTPGFYECEFAQKHSQIPLLRTSKGYAHSGCGVYATPELTRLVKAGGTVRVKRGLVYDSCRPIFADYVHSLYELKRTGNDAESAIAKLLLNSLYGKYGTRRETKRVEQLSHSKLAELVKQGKKTRLLSAECGLVEITDRNDRMRGHVGIASIITSEARARLWEMMDQHTVYVDTDSIHTLRDRGKGSAKLGELKLERCGPANYIGPKLYRVGETVRAKGFSDLRGSDGAAIIDRAGDGEEVLVTCRTSARMLRVLSGRKPCQITKQPKKLRKTVA